MKSYGPWDILDIKIVATPLHIHKALLASSSQVGSDPTDIIHSTNDLFDEIKAWNSSDGLPSTISYGCGWITPPKYASVLIGATKGQIL